MSAFHFIGLKNHHLRLLAKSFGSGNYGKHCSLSTRSSQCLLKPIRSSRNWHDQTWPPNRVQYSSETVTTYLIDRQKLSEPRIIYGNVGLNLGNSLHLHSHSSQLFPVLRYIHTSVIALKEETKLEKSVKVLKEKAAPQPVDVVKVEPPKKSIGQRIIAEVKHYYHGFRLLFIDIKVARRLLWRVLNGKSLSRREKRQMVRTTADLFRLVPFAVFIIVPFMEFLLPVALKLFPNMLPSTFKEENREQEKNRTRLKVKLQMAKFLQDTIEESAIQRKGGQTSSEAADFAAFIQKVRSAGGQTTNEEIITFSKLFEDEITLDNLKRAHLAALCRLVELPTMGSNTFLRFQLRMKLRQLKADDMEIKKEGIDEMEVWELQEALRARGMRALGLTEARMKSQLQQWLDLHLNYAIPTSLLLLSRALYLPEDLSARDQLTATISSLPEATAEEAKVKIQEVSGEKVDNKAKLEYIRHQEEAIREEKAEKLAAEKQEKLPAPEVLTESLTPPAGAEPVLKEELVDKAPVIEDVADKVTVTPFEEISTKDLEGIEEALENIIEEKKIGKEERELGLLKEEVQEYQEDLQDLKDVVLATGGIEKDVRESKGARRLRKKVNSMIGQMDSIVNQLHKEKEELIEDIEVKEVRLKRSMKDDDDAREKLIENISEKKKKLDQYQ